MRRVTTYDRLHRHIRAWADCEIECLLVLGRPGTGKSHAFRDALVDQPHHLFSARKTPIQVYIELHDDPCCPVVFDDVSALLRDNNFVDLLKNLCETGTRSVRWGTSTPLLNGRANSFVCTAPVLIVLNRMPDNNPDVMAILDRCDGIEFDPPKPEVIGRMREVFPSDHALIDLFAELPVIPSLRTLVKARRWQQSRHLDWRAELIAECGVPEAVHVLMQIMQNLPEEDWAGCYVQMTGLTSRTFRRHRQVAEQLVACHAPQNGCPDVRAGEIGKLFNDPDRNDPTAKENGGTAEGCRRLDGQTLDEMPNRVQLPAMNQCQADEEAECPCKLPIVGGSESERGIAGHHGRVQDQSIGPK